MAANRSIQSYGGIYVDQEAVTNPQTQMAADKGNRLMEDVAQGTRVWNKVDVKFSTTSTAAPTSVTPTTGQTQWGTGSSYLPTISKTANGTYTVTYASSYDDALVNTTSDAVAESETLALEYARASIMGLGAGATAYATASANVITVYVYDNTDALSDLGGGVAIWVEAK